METTGISDKLHFVQCRGIGPHDSFRLKKNKALNIYTISSKSLKALYPVSETAKSHVHIFLPEDGADDALKASRDFMNTCDKISHATITKIDLLGSGQTLNWIHGQIKDIPRSDGSNSWLDVGAKREEFQNFRNLETLPRPSERATSDSLDYNHGVVLDLGEKSVTVENTSPFLLNYDANGACRVKRNNGYNVQRVYTKVIIANEINTAVFSRGSKVPTAQITLGLTAPLPIADAMPPLSFARSFTEEG